MRIVLKKFKYNYLILILLSITSIYCQEKLTNRVQDSIVFDSLVHKRIYKIDLANSELSIELLETLNDEYYGFFSITLYKEINDSSELFVGRIEIENLIVKDLMNQFEKKQIKNILDSNDLNNCIRFLDTDYTNFKIYLKNLKRSYSFEVLTPYDKMPHIPKNRKQALKILKLLNDKINFKKKYREFLKKLPKGTYINFRGYTIGRFTIN
ncbi:hypothetical protein [Flavobacterium sp.]|uniref:hypothetical protein n=1 Tax=Flavobacterium sp. TaxID=239 RepID=UPI0037500E59